MIAAAAVELIDSAGMDQFSVQKLASAMGVGPTSIHAHFKGGTQAISRAVVLQALAGTARPFKPKEEPAEYLRELFLKILEALHARPGSPILSFFACRQIQFWIPFSPNDCS